ncbi:MAG: amidohydrolase family protein [Alphaproteobacteria bacterium]|nr:amidohydrolase family protein [Alphaproteobacteria bacterium]
MTRIHLKNCTILDPRENEALRGGAILIEGSVIKEVAERPISAQAELVFDAGGRTVMPGLIDAHVHAIAIDANLANLQNVPQSLLAFEARDLLEAMLRRGFTTVRDAGGADFGLAEAVEKGLVAGPRMFIAGRALSQTGGHGDLRARTAGLDACACCQGAAALGRIADGVSEVRRAARDELRRGAHQIKIMASGGVASPNDPIWTLQYSEEEIRAIVEEAAAWQTYVMAHAYTPAAIRRAVSFGVRSIEHGNLIDAETAGHVADHGAFVVPTLATYDALERFGRDLGIPEVSIAKLKDVREAGLGSLEHLRRAGVKTGFGTDLLGAMQVHQSNEFSIRAEILSPIEVIRAATIVNAELLRMEGKLGVIAPGAFADLLVVDGDPLKDLRLLQEQGAHLKLIMKGGKVFKNELR